MKANSAPFMQGDERSEAAWRRRRRADEAYLEWLDSPEGLQERARWKAADQTRVRTFRRRQPVTEYRLVELSEPLRCSAPQCGALMPAGGLVLADVHTDARRCAATVSDEVRSYAAWAHLGGLTEAWSELACRHLAAGRLDLHLAGFRSYQALVDLRRLQAVVAWRTDPRPTCQECGRYRCAGQEPICSYCKAKAQTKAKSDAAKAGPGITRY